MSNLKYLIVYHKEDNDGVLSAAIFMDYLIKKSVDSTDINMCGYTYGELMNEDINKWNQIYDHIIMLDISFNDYKKMIQLKKDFGKNFCWIDHHSPIIVESIFRKFDDINGVRQTDRSTILLTYKYLYDPFDEKYHNKTCPELFRILSAYDSWTYEQEGYHFDEVDNINKAVTFESELDIRNMVKYINIDNTTEDSEIKRLEKIGSLLTDYDRFRYKRLISDYEDVWKIDTGDGTFLNCSVLFTQGPSNSTMFYTSPNDLGAVLKRNSNGTWTISLYNKSTDGFHCGRFLKKKYNGGGHHRAAGCTISDKQFLKILKHKII